jgi:hydroxyacylglutathione hydrolase
MKSWQTKSGLKIFKILSGRSNVFLLSNDLKNILIDTSPANRWNKLEKSLEENKVDNIDYLILTHSHFDHAGNTNRIKKKFGCPVILHRSEDHNLKTGEICIPKGANPFSRLIVNNLASRLSHRFKCELSHPDILVDSEFDLNPFGFNARILHTPGHSPGSVSIIADDEIAIVGDTMFGVFRWSVFPPFAENVSQLVNSWGILLGTSCKIFLPSHGGSKNRSQLYKDYQKRRAISTV